MTLSATTALLATWRRTGRPVVHIQHMSQRPDSPLRPDRPGNAIKPEAAPAPGEPVPTVQRTAEILAETGSPG